jgi:hypothetical protein
MPGTKRGRTVIVQDQRLRRFRYLYETNRIEQIKAEGLDEYLPTTPKIWKDRGPEIPSRPSI